MAINVTIRFKKVVQNRQELAVDDESMISTVYFDVVVGGRVWPDQEVNIKQTAGAGFEADRGALEVLGNASYEGPGNYQGFRDCVEGYYRSLVGSTGHGIHVGQGATGIRMYNNTFVQPAECSYEAE